jgi:thioredoxin 1
MAKAVTDANFESEVLKATGPVLVDFWAEWCGPCKALSPVLDELSSDLGDKVKVVKVNIDEAPNAPTKYNVRGIPTLILFKNGQVVDTRVGGAPKAQLKDWVESKI